MEQITVAVIVEKGVEKVWECWNEPEHITHWAFASEDWECPYAKNDNFTVGGTFITRMAAKDGSMSFDLEGVYTEVVPYEKIAYTMGDRAVSIVFTKVDESTTKVTESFDPETLNPFEMQRGGWQAILNNFKKYTESV